MTEGDRVKTYFQLARAPIVLKRCLVKASHCTHAQDFNSECPMEAGPSINLATSLASSIAQLCRANPALECGNANVGASSHKSQGPSWMRVV